MKLNKFFTPERIETIAVVFIGIFLLLFVEPVTPSRQIFAGLLGGLVLVLVAISAWRWTHERHG